MFCLSSCVSTKHASISGKARVVDGDTLFVNSTKIRLAFIDAPELKQTCIHKKNKRVIKCGEQSKSVLQKLIEGKNILCTERASDLYRRVLAECYLNTIDINQYMISSGYAILYKTSRKYLAEQEKAKKSGKGIWKTDFQEPWVWRKED